MGVFVFYSLVLEITLVAIFILISIHPVPSYSGTRSKTQPSIKYNTDESSVKTRLSVVRGPETPVKDHKIYSSHTSISPLGLAIMVLVIREPSRPRVIVLFMVASASLNSFIDFQ